MRQITLLVVLFSSTFSWAQTRGVGTISDPDGYTNLRSGKGRNFEIVARIQENEVFVFYDSTDQNWLKIAITRCRCDEPKRMYDNIIGFMHRSRITKIEELSPKKRKKLFISIFENEKSLYERVKAGDRTTEEYHSIRAEMNVYHDYQFDPILGAFEKYLCEHKDRELLAKFLNVLEVETGSADEMPSFTLGAIFMCDPDWVFQSMKNHVGLMNQLEWGIVNIGYDGLKEESTKLKKKYNELRVSIGLEKTDFSLYEE